MRSFLHGAASTKTLAKLQRSSSKMAYTFRPGDLPKLDLQVDRGTDFKAWKTQWEAYHSLSGLSTQNQQKQVQALTLCFTRETLTIVENLGLTREQRGSVADIVTAIQSYVEGQINESVERRHFRQRKQQHGETFDDFLVSLRELAKTCNFCSDECTQKGIRDQIVEGLLDGDTVEDLLKEADLTLQTTVSKCRAQEAAKQQRAEITSTPIGHTAVQAVRRNPSARQQQPLTGTCPGCGSPHHQGGRQQCPAFRATCRSCGKAGHFARVCRSRGPQPAPPTNQPTASPDPQHPPTANTVYVGPTTYPQIYQTSSPHIEPAPTITVQMSALHGEATVKALPDSGADISIAGPSLLGQLNEHPDNLIPSSMVPRAVNGSTMQPLGKLPIRVKLGARHLNEEFHIYPTVSGVLLSWKAAKNLNILPPQYPKPIHPQDPPQVAANTVTPHRDIRDEYPTVFDGKIKSMEGEYFHIALTDDAKPFCVRTPRTIPYAYRDKLKAELDLLQEQNVIAPVTEPTEWCAPIVVTPKKGTDKIRMCVDLSHLNKYVKRERYQCSTPAEAVADIAANNAKVFTKLDALKGYHQCPLDEKSQSLTTFITPFGRYKYLRAPYGISSISEHYNRRMDEAFSGLTGYRRIVDDIVIYDSDETQHAQHVRQFLQRCAEQRITLNPDKWEYAQPHVTFAGFSLSQDGYSVDSSITDAIANFPTPSNRTDLRAFFGLANQLAASTDALAGLLGPLRPLLSTKNEFIWLPDHEQAFQEAKTSLTVAPTLQFFDPQKPTRLCTDASRQGLGFVLQQKHGDRWALIQAGSRFLSDAESRYAIIELELLGVTWAVTKCKIFLAGLSHFSIVTDHHPLVPILNNYRLDEIENPRLQRLKSKIMAYNFSATWIKGNLNHAPDALSRNPVSDPETGDLLAENMATCAEVRALTSCTQESLRLTDLRQQAEGDHEYQQLKKYIYEGFPPHRNQLLEQCRRYWNLRNQLTIEDDLIVYGCRLLIPSAMRHSVLVQLHSAHQGSVRTRQRAKQVVYWPGIDNDIDNIILQCKQCQETLPSQPREPLIAKPRPTRPFQEIAIDFCTYGGQQFLILIDCYTDWPEIIQMGQNTTTSHLIAVLLDAFGRHGVPDVIWSDQGPQFMSHMFSGFAQEWGFQHITSSPTYPQSNGKAESAVKSMKKIIEGAWARNHMNAEKLVRALLQYRNTPSRRDGLSPAQKLFGQPIQDTLPAHHSAFAPQWQQGPIEDNSSSHEDYYNQHAQTLPEIAIGTNVAIQNDTTKRWDIYGVVTEVGPFRRYHVKTSTGRVLVRNRRYIRRRVPVVPPTVQNIPNPPIQINLDPPAIPRRSARQHRRPLRYIEEFAS